MTGPGTAATRHPLEHILEPESVAVIGASKDESKRGNQTISALQEWGFDGAVYPVNPKHAGDEIQGLDVYGSVGDIPATVDLAYIVTPAPIVPQVLEECGEAGVTGALVIAAGFSEIGNDELEAKIVETARKHDIRMIGPNINGLINVHHNLDLLDRNAIPPGGIAMLSQSGNIASGLVFEGLNSDTGGFSFYISVGNESDLEFHEYLPYLAAHDETDVGMLYVEGMNDGRSFLREARDFVQQKPLTVLKGGLSDAGKQSAASHTASIAGNGAVIDDVYEQAGVVRVERLDELLTVTDTLGSQPPAQGPNIGILSDGGGHATHASDCLVDHGLRVPDLQKGTQQVIDDAVPDQAPNTVNPVDVVTLEHDMSIFTRCAEAMLEDPAIDALLICGYFGGYGDNLGEENTEDEIEVAEQIATLPDEYGKPIVTQTMFAENDFPAINTLKQSDIPVVESVNTATRCVAALETYGTHLEHADQKGTFTTTDPPQSSDIVTDVLQNDRTVLSEYEAKELLAEYEAPVTPYYRATDEHAVETIATEFDEPLAMKVLSRDIVHKSDANGVALNVNPETATEAYADLLAAVGRERPDADIDGVLISPMVDTGTEIIVGITVDEEVGPVIMFGLGGIFVEILEDVVFRAPPLTRFDANEMLDSIQGAPLLEGARGGEAIDRDALIDLLLTISDIATANPEIAELDINPAFVSPNGIEIVDAAVTLSTESELPRD